MKNRFPHKIQMILAFIICVFTLISAPSCIREVEIDSVEKGLFVESTQVGLYKDGKELLIYEEKIHQLSINSKRRIIRFQNDDQSTYCHLELETIPRSKGVNILATIAINMDDKKEDYTILLECSQIEGGNMWLWNKENKLGFIIPFPLR